MAMNWIKGLVAPAAQFVQQGAQQMQQPGMQPPGMQQADPNQPPMGGQSPYGVGQPMGQPQQAPQQPPMDMGGYQAPMQWSTGTRTQGAAQAAPQGASNISGGGVSGGGISGGAQSQEARIAELQNNVASLALFARTLLTMLEEAKVVTRQQFEETKNRLDAMDGKIDDR